MTEPFEMLFGCRLRWVIELCSILGSRSPTWRGTFDGVTLGFCRTPPSTIPSGPDVRIPQHAVIDQHSKWPAIEAVKCHIKFSQWKIPCVMWAVVKMLWVLVVFYYWPFLHVCTLQGNLWFPLILWSVFSNYRDISCILWSEVMVQILLILPRIYD